MPNSDFSYPWFASLQAQLDGQYVADKLPHAILLTGETYSGKLVFATQLTKRLLCDETKALTTVTSVACNQCASCHLFEAGTHPDFAHVTPQDSKQIKIDQVRRAFVSAIRQSQRPNGRGRRPKRTAHDFGVAKNNRPHAASVGHGEVVASQIGTYFRITTFRRLNDHTRLILSFLSLGREASD